jgi:hypothetical protein
MVAAPLRRRRKGDCIMSTSHDSGPAKSPALSWFAFGRVSGVVTSNPEGPKVGRCAAIEGGE